MPNYRVVSSDNHNVEPRDLWTSRGESKFDDRLPRIVRKESGADWWVVDGHDIISVEVGTQAGVRFEEPEKLRLDQDTFEDVRPGGYIPEEHIKDMDIDGIDVSIIYPTIALGMYSNCLDGELLSSIFKTYNDWVSEFCKPFPKRLKGIALLNIDDVQEGISEMERCAKLGFTGAVISVYPPQNRPYDTPEYEPLWAAAQDLQMPLSLHIGTGRPGQGPGSFENVIGISPSFFANVDHWVRMSLGQMIFSGVFERYPKLQVGSVEHELSWVPHFLDRIDYTYTQRQIEVASYRFKEDMLPSDYFHRNVFVGFQEDALGTRDRHIIGVDNLLWGADYPHPESTFPRSREILEEILADCTEEEKAKIVGGNSARVYNLD